MGIAQKIPRVQKVIKVSSSKGQSLQKWPADLSTTRPDIGSMYMYFFSRVPILSLFPEHKAQLRKTIMNKNESFRYITTIQMKGLRFDTVSSSSLYSNLLAIML